MKNAIVNYPDLAETTFQALCDERGVIRNKATQDVAAWDYLVEFQRTPIPDAAHDQQVGTSTARVQVKSVAGGRCSTKLKLTNALRFTREPDICFVVLFWYPKDGGPPNIYARHFDADLMTATLKRAREADRDGHDALNRILIPVNFTDGDDHSADLMAWMHRICDQQPESYAATKRTLVERVGFDANSITGTYTVMMKDMQALIDHSVGLLPNAPIEHITLENRRFGIPARKPIFSGKPTVAQINATPRPAILTVSGKNGHTARISGEVRNFALPGLPMETARATFFSPCVQLLIKGDGHCQLSFNFEDQKAYPLSVLIQFCRFQMASRSRMTLGIEAEDWPRISTNARAQRSKSNTRFNWLSFIVEALALACGSGNDPALSVQQIAACEDDVSSFAQYLTEGEFTLRFSLDRDNVDLPNLKNLLAYDLVDVGGHIFWIVMRRPCLRQEREGRKYVLAFGNSVILDAGVGDAPFADLREHSRARTAAILTQMGKGTVVLNDGGFRQSDNVLDINIA